MQIWKSGIECPEVGYQDLKAYLNQASYHFADDNGNEYQKGSFNVQKAADLAIAQDWPMWAIQRMFREINPLVTWDQFLTKYIDQLKNRVKELEAKDFAVRSV